MLQITGSDEKKEPTRKNEFPIELVSGTVGLLVVGRLAAVFIVRSKRKEK